MNTISRLDIKGKSFFYCNECKGFLLEHRCHRRIIESKKIFNFKKTKKEILKVKVIKEVIKKQPIEVIPPPRIKKTKIDQSKMNFIVGCPSSGTRWLYGICWSVLPKGFEYIKAGKITPEPHRTYMIKEVLTNKDDKVLHIIRDGRDVVASRKKSDHAPDDVVKHYPDNMEKYKKYAHAWNYFVEEGMKNRGHPNYLEIKYESLVDNFRETYFKIIDFFCIKHDPNTFKEEGIKVNSILNAIGRRRELTAEELEESTKIMYNNLKILGYIDASK